MKTTLATLILVMAVAGAGFSQNMNWRAEGASAPNAVQLNVGYDYGMTAQLGYTRSVAWLRPFTLGVDFSLPMGSELTDDFKVRLGGQMEVVAADGFSASVKILSIFRRYQTALVRIAGFGSELGLVAGYYTPSWHAAGEFGFDKAITTNLLHSDLMRSNFPAVKDGWYIPTGGHFYYGVQAGKTIGEVLDITLRVGATRAQFTDENAALPYYLQLGIGTRF